MVKIARYFNKNKIDVYEDIQMKINIVSDTMGVDEIDFIKYFSNKKKCNIPIKEAKNLADRYRIKLDARGVSASKLKKLEKLDSYVDWSKFCEDIEKLSELSITNKKESKTKRDDYKSAVSALDEIYEKIEDLVMN
jgi:hypothetical protein